MCLGKTNFICPKCKQRFSVARPDGSHSDGTIETPTQEFLESQIITQPYTCPNINCRRKINIYWYNEQMYLDRT